MSLDMGMLIAGAKLQGEFEDRLIQARPALAALAAQQNCRVTVQRPHHGMVLYHDGKPFYDGKRSRSSSTGR
jgi:hypothetical protein